MMVGELKNILIPGVARNQSTKLVDNEEEADYIFLGFRHLQDELYKITRPEKTIIIDYRDEQLSIFPQEVLSYFKRSVVHRKTNDFVSYTRMVNPISYCVREEYLCQEAQFPAVREVDIAVFFDPNTAPSKIRNYYRHKVARIIKEEFGNLNIFVGIAGQSGVAGRNEFQQAYFDLMIRSKIVVTCNPDRWEGDYRLFEALSSGSLVMTDKMRTPVIRPFSDGEHLVYYDKENLEVIVENIRELLGNDKRRLEIAKNGYEYAMNFHTSGNRIEEIIQKVAA